MGWLFYGLTFGRGMKGPEVECVSEGGTLV